MQPQTPLDPTQQPQQPQLTPDGGPDSQPNVAPSQPQTNNTIPQATATTPNDNQSSAQETPKRGELMNTWVESLINTNPKMKYGLALLIVPVIAITLLQGESIGDVFSQKVSGRELRELVQSTVNKRKASYGYKISSPTDVTCSGALKNKYGATVNCTINASRTIGGKIEGEINATVTVRSTKTGSSPMQIDL